jgi:hypothetical protein
MELYASDAGAIENRKSAGRNFKILRAKKEAQEAFDAKIN